MSELELVDGRGAATSAGVVCPASCDELGLDVTSRLYQTRANVHTDVGGGRDQTRFTSKLFQLRE